MIYDCFSSCIPKRLLDTLLFDTCIDLLLIHKFDSCVSVSAHHKSKEALEHRNPLLQWYYSIYPLFGYCCVGTELFYILLYVLHHFPHPLVSQVKKRDRKEPVTFPVYLIRGLTDLTITVLKYHKCQSTSLSPDLPFL